MGFQRHRMTSLLLLGSMIAFLFLPCALAQETVAGFQGVVKDASGAVIANAIHDAIGARVLQLPMTPARILEALKKG